MAIVVRRLRLDRKYERATAMRERLRLRTASGAGDGNGEAERERRQDKGTRVHREPIHQFEPSESIGSTFRDRHASSRHVGAVGGPEEVQWVSQAESARLTYPSPYWPFSLTLRRLPAPELIEHFLFLLGGQRAAAREPAALVEELRENLAELRIVDRGRRRGVGL